MPSHAAPIQAVLFDYGLVLSGPAHPPAWERMKSVLHAQEEPFHAAYWRSRHDYDRGTLTGEQYWQEVARNLGQTLDAASLKSLIEADTALWTQPNQPMIDWAAALQNAGIRTGILSNIGDEMELGVLAHCPWLNRFSHLTFSHRLRIAKPEAAIYQHAAAGLGVRPEHILFIDDREDNIAAARNAGMQTIQYTDHPAFTQALRKPHLEHLLSPQAPATT